VDDFEATIMRSNLIPLSLVSGSWLKAYYVTGDSSLRTGVRVEDNGVLGQNRVVRTSTDRNKVMWERFSTARRYLDVFNTERDAGSG
jgi:hypothetical protein